MTTKGMRQRVRRRHAKTEGILKQIRAWSAGREGADDPTEPGEPPVFSDVDRPMARVAPGRRDEEEEP